MRGQRYGSQFGEPQLLGRSETNRYERDAADAEFLRVGEDGEKRASVFGDVHEIDRAWRAALLAGCRPAAAKDSRCCGQPSPPVRKARFSPSNQFDIDEQLLSRFA